MTRESIQDPTGAKGPVMNGVALFRRFAERVVASIEAGHSRVKVAELYNMALSTVGGFIKRKRETAVSVQTVRRVQDFTLEPHTDRVKELVAEQPVVRLQSFKFAAKER